MSWGEYIDHKLWFNLGNGTSYNYQKNRMRIYIQSVDYELWRIIVSGPRTPTTKVENADVSKPESE